MKQLHVGLVVKPTSPSFERDARSKGYFSYEVPEFTWEHITLGKYFYQDTRALAKQFDIVVHEDGGNWGQYIGNALPIVFISFDDTLSEGHFKERLSIAQQAGLILVDHGDLSRFGSTGKPVYRFPHCVNDLLFCDTSHERDIDVAFNCGKKGSDERQRLQIALKEFCAARELKYDGNLYPPDEYANVMARTRIVANWPRTPENRPHRVFDAMACGACLVTGPLPVVDGDLRITGEDYIEVQTESEILAAISKLLRSGEWLQIAKNGHELVMKHHTWSARAKQLRDMIERTFGL